jgi:hypothetical protein
MTCLLLEIFWLGDNIAIKYCLFAHHIDLGLHVYYTGLSIVTEYEFQIHSVSTWSFLGVSFFKNEVAATSN